MPTIDALRRTVRNDYLADGHISSDEAKDLVDSVRADASTPGQAIDQLLKIRSEFEDDFKVRALKSFDAAMGLPALSMGVTQRAGNAQLMATHRAIGAAEQVIGGLEVEIEALERANESKQAEVDRLVSSIDARKGEIRRTRERKRRIGIFGILMGVPAVGAVSLVQMMDDDGRLRSLNRDLQDAKAEQAQLHEKAAAYEDNTDALRADLDVLRQKEGGLRAVLDAAPAPTGGPLPAHKMRVLQQGGDALTTSKQLLSNLQEQIAVLEQIKGAAGDLGGDLDGVIDDLRRKEAKAAKLVAQSEKALMDLVRIVTSPNPEAAATKWLNKEVSKRTEAVLKQLGLSVKAYANDLAKRAVPDDGSAVSKQLQKQLSSWLVKRLQGEPAGRAPRLAPSPDDVDRARDAAGLD